MSQPSKIQQQGEAARSVEGRNGGGAGAVRCHAVMKQMQAHGAPVWNLGGRRFNAAQRFCCGIWRRLCRQEGYGCCLLSTQSATCGEQRPEPRMGRWEAR